MAPEAQSNDDYSDLLRLTEEQFQELVTASKMPEGSDPALPGRNQMRFASARESRRVGVGGTTWIPVTLNESGGSARRVRAYPIDISSGGISFFVGMYVHAGTVLQLTLTLHDGERLSLQGVTTNCRLVSGRAHRVGVKFSKPFDMALLMSPEKPAELGASGVERSPRKGLGTGSPGASNQGLTPGQDPGSEDAELLAPSSLGARVPAAAGSGGLSAEQLARIKRATQELLAYVGEFAGKVMDH